MYLVVSTSTNAHSKSRSLAKASTELLQGMSGDAHLLDLAKFPLPLHDGTSNLPESGVQLAESINAAVGLILVLPVYHSDVSVSARNLIQWTGPAWQRKVVGITSLAGDGISHKASVELANLLMLEHRSFVVPDFALIDSRTFLDASGRISAKAMQKLQKTSENVYRVTEALKHA